MRPPQPDYWLVEIWGKFCRVLALASAACTSRANPMVSRAIVPLPTRSPTLPLASFSPTSGRVPRPFYRFSNIYLQLAIWCQAASSSNTVPTSGPYSCASLLELRQLSQHRKMLFAPKQRSDRFPSRKATWKAGLVTRCKPHLPRGSCRRSAPSPDSGS